MVWNSSNPQKCGVIDVAPRPKRFHHFCSYEFTQSCRLSSRLVMRVRAALTLLSKQAKDGCVYLTSGQRSRTHCFCQKGAGASTDSMATSLCFLNKIEWNEKFRKRKKKFASENMISWKPSDPDFFFLFSLPTDRRKVEGTMTQQCVTVPIATIYEDNIWTVWLQTHIWSRPGKELQS